MLTVTDIDMPCRSDPDAWFSTVRAVARDAARRCLGCPFVAPCRDLGQSERWGVWGGVIRHRTSLHLGRRRSE